MRQVLPLLCASAAIALGSPGRAAVVRGVALATTVGQDAATQAVTEAAVRFGIPAGWIWAVIRAESGGDPHAISSKGALGLMQVMPATYAALRLQLRLGADPFDIHNNVIAGAAYLRSMFDRYGLIGMVGAYNAGPARWDAYLAGAQALPNDTAAYLVKLASTLGFDASSTSSDASRAAPKAPSEPAMFVALKSRAAADQLQAERQRMIEAIAENPTPVASSPGPVDRAPRAEEAALIGDGVGLRPPLPRPSNVQGSTLFAPISNGHASP